MECFFKIHQDSSSTCMLCTPFLDASPRHRRSKACGKASEAAGSRLSSARPCGAAWGATEGSRRRGQDLTTNENRVVFICPDLNTKFIASFEGIYIYIYKRQNSSMKLDHSNSFDSSVQGMLMMSLLKNCDEGDKCLSTSHLFRAVAFHRKKSILLCDHTV